MRPFHPIEQSAKSGRKHIIILATGGTIAGTGAPGQSGSYKAGELPVSSILSSLPEAAAMADLTLIDICALDSNDIQMSHYQMIKKYVEKFDQDHSVDGIVITHGTDTLEESAFLLNLTLNVRKPVVMTGAMRPATAVSADGPANLLQAIALACKPAAGGHGVLVVLSNTIYSARDLEKTNSIKTDAFRPGSFGTLGYIQDQHAHLLHTPYGFHTFSSPFCDLDLNHLPAVEIFYVHQQADPRLLSWMLQQYQGVIIAGTGSGNYSREIADVISASAESSVIVRASRLSDGIVFESEEFDPMHKTIPGYRFSPHKARLLLMLALARTKDRNQIQSWFENC